ncbi:MAG: biotin transporter BioY [Gemmatimonadales bacterium]|nr:biotin transporter BioY [Gemmatimonadales bacterium]NIN10827.1 biotin transporter BioY [Gemmatimonadales bacterium]NIN49470.1 biotin transporter BioY [Gemmatimonadales bacterium]NIP06934.1 biotin transporter BioY [Gemmatimonadales bacterium]NIR01610.1 biotin transporter BioY [Gemmatimonadales bacterium]
MNDIRTAHLSMTPTAVVRRSLAILAGAVLVALSAQVAIPLPGNPVPITLQVPAVLIVGGLLGPRLGAASMIVYLAFGAAGLPVFAPTGMPGVARLFGPTGGYLLAYPLAAALVALIIGHGRSWLYLALGLVAGVAVIHVGGVAQLAILTGDVRTAVSLGSLPFLLLDVVKVLVAGLLIWRLRSKTRALL